jgi:hypothetical protein
VTLSGGRFRSSWTMLFSPRGVSCHNLRGVVYCICTSLHGFITHITWSLLVYVHIRIDSAFATVFHSQPTSGVAEGIHKPLNRKKTIICSSSIWRPWAGYLHRHFVVFPPANVRIMTSRISKQTPSTSLQANYLNLPYAFTNYTLLPQHSGGHN